MQNEDPSMATSHHDAIDTRNGEILTEYEINAKSVEHSASNGFSSGSDPSLTAPPDDIDYPEERLGIGTSGLERITTPELPIIPIPIARRTVSGSYSGTASGFRLDLRVDVDRPGTLSTASFDFFQIAGAVTTYFGSFKLGAAAISYTATNAVIEAPFTGTVSVWANRVRIQIPRNTILVPAGAATVTFFNGATPGSAYTCAFQSIYFRTVRLETDCEAGTTLLGNYNTALMPNPGPNRVLNVASAYQEAGINMVYTGSNNIINTSESGADSRWTESEMHASMVAHFSAYSSQPQWAVWLFAARRATSSSLLGIMFDYLGMRPHRQGCAVFQDTIRSYHPTANDYNRHLLYTYVHELGHAFNLLHSWDKGRPSSPSWMNYDWRYDSINGAGAYWNNFAFTFDSGEIRHMRHGFRNAVIMGGNDWAVGAGLEQPHAHNSVFATEIVQNNSGLKLELEPVKKSYAFGEPVVTEIKLKCMDLNGKTVNSNIHPKYEYVRIGIMKPNGQVVAYEPVAHNCAVPKWEQLTAEKNTVYASAYIGYGKDGFYFDQPGFYKLKAAYLAEDGSVIQSEEVTIRIKTPLTKEEDAIADLYFTNEAGMVFYLLGSDSPDLQSGMNSLKQVSDQYAGNELSLYANLVLGINDAMRYKTADSKSGTVHVRERHLSDATKYLSPVFRQPESEKSIDNITLNFAYRHLAKGFLLEGDEETAKSVLQDLEKKFKQKSIKKSVKQTIAMQAAEVLKLK